MLVPSFSDLFFLSLLVWLFMTVPDGWSRLLGDGDTGWHIRAGEWVLDHGTVPRTDLFSFTKQGESWFAWEWGSDVAFALLHRAWGLKGVALFGGVMVGLFATLLFRYVLWRGANSLIALVFSLLAVGASSLHYLARPHLFTLVLLPVALWVLERDVRANSRALWLLVPLAAVWTNLHGGFMALIAMTGLYAAGTILRTLLTPAGEPRLWAPARRYSLLAGLCAAASVVNPYGVELHRHVFAYLRSDWIREAIQEFQSPSFRNENILQFELVLLVGLVACGGLIARRAFPEVLCILFWAHQALGSVRHVTVFVTVAAPMVACELTRLWERFAEGASRRSTRRILQELARDLGAGFRWTSVWPAAVIAVLLLVDTPIRWPQDFPAERFPVKMIRQHAGLIRQGRVLTTDQWGDYLIYRFYPTLRVYIDGRSDFYGPTLGREYVRLSYGQYDWRRIVEQHQFNVMLIPVEWSLGSLIKQEPSWRLVADDGKALLFVADNSPPRKASGAGTKKSAAALTKSAKSAELCMGDHGGMKDETAKHENPHPARSAAEADASDWRLPSGLQLAEFALRGGFIAPGLLTRSPMAPLPAFDPAAAQRRESSGQPSARTARKRTAGSPPSDTEEAAPVEIAAGRLSRRGGR